MKLPAWILGAIALTAFGSPAFVKLAIAEMPASPTTPVAPAPATAPVPPPLPEITNSQFDRMQLGMTVADITTLLGRNSVGEQNRTQANSGTMVYQWQLQDSDRIAQVVFHNGRVVGRTAWAMRIEPSPTPAPETVSNPNAPTQSDSKPQ
jgi:hypothetical protein